MTFKNLFKASNIVEIVPWISRITQEYLESQILPTPSNNLEYNFSNSKNSS